MLGARQLGWFQDRLKRGKSLWKVWGTEVMVMATRLGPGIPAQVDAWDGDGYERKLILDYVLDNDIQNVVAITGDIHTFFTGTAYTTGDKSTGRAALPESSAAPPPHYNRVAGGDGDSGLHSGRPDQRQPPHQVLRLRQARLRGD